jgi:hypothetical protein
MKVIGDSLTGRKVYQILLDGVEAGYVQASHESAALTEAQRVIEEWGKQYGPIPPQWQLEAKEIYLWDAKFYTGTTMEDMTVGAALRVLAYSVEDVRRRTPDGYHVYEVNKSRM